MSAKVTYTIGGKYDKSGEQNALAGLKKLTSAAKLFNLQFAGQIATKAFTTLKSALNGSTEGFTKQQKAILQFNKAVQNNAKITSDSLEDIQKVMNEVSFNNLIDGDTINNAAALASNMGLDADQIQNVLKASSELYSAGLMPMDTAVKALAQSYNGTTTSLAKICPEISNLTKEELANGDAVAILNEKYSGFSATLAGSFSGRDTQFKNSMDDLKASVGGIGEALKFVSEGKTIGTLNQISEWITNNRKAIINMFLNIPELLDATLDYAVSVLSKFFTVDGFMSYAKIAFNFTVECIKSVFNVLVSVFDATVGNMFRSMEDLFGRIGNSLIEKVNVVLAKIISLPVFKQIYELLSGNSLSDFEGISFRFNTNNSASNKSFTTVVETATAEFKNVASAASSSLSQITADYKEENETFSNRVSDILQKDLPEDLSKALQNKPISTNTTIVADETEDTTPDTSNGSSSGSLVSYTDSIGDVKNAIFSSLGQFGNLIKNILEKNPIGILITAIKSFIGAMQDASENFSKFCNLFDTVFSAACEVIGDELDETFAPFVDGLQTIGRIIGDVINPALDVLNDDFGSLGELGDSILHIIEPIVAIIFKLIGFLGKLEPSMVIISGLLGKLADFFDYVADKLTDFFNAIIRAINKFIKVLNKIPFVDISYISEIDSDTDSDSDSTSSSSTASGSATYSGAKDLYINIYYNNSYVNGDAREIALSLRAEIKAAEALGY